MLLLLRASAHRPIRIWPMAMPSVRSLGEPPSTRRVGVPCGLIRAGSKVAGTPVQQSPNAAAARHARYTCATTGATTGSGTWTRGMYLDCVHVCAAHDGRCRPMAGRAAYRSVALAPACTEIGHQSGPRPRNLSTRKILVYFFLSTPLLVFSIDWVHWGLGQRLHSLLAVETTLTLYL